MGPPVERLLGTVLDRKQSEAPGLHGEALSPCSRQFRPLWFRVSSSRSTDSGVSSSLRLVDLNLEFIQRLKVGS